MKLFWKYIKSKYKVIIAFLLFCIIFTLIFALYHLPIQAVIYPALLCILIAVIFIAEDFNKTRYRHNELSVISRFTSAMISDLPKSKSIDDEDYKAIICALQSKINEIETSSNSKYRDMVEYYTIWVHQIKTPIASMRLQLQNEDSAESRQLQSDLFRIEQYVEMVLAFLRLDSTSSDYIFKEHSLDLIIHQAIKKFSHEFIGRKIGLEYESVNEMIVTDEKWLSFVIEQIISNALKYTYEGNIKIYIQQPKTLCIEDTGIGIAPEDLPRIFENGYTGYNGHSDKKASGIGLYLCKRVCDNLGIDISAKSQISKGTVILLNLEQNEINKY